MCEMEQWQARVTRNLSGAGEETEVAEAELAADFRQMIDAVDVEPSRKAEPYTVALMEDAWRLRLLSFRLEKCLGAEGVTASKGGSKEDSEVSKVHPVMDALVKTRERYRKVLKELFERLGVGKKPEVRNYPDEMKLLLDRTEGVLEDAIRNKARKERARGKGAQPGRNKEMVNAS